MGKKTIITYLVSIAVFALVLLGTSNTAFADAENLSWGSRGQAVVQVQQTLNRIGYWCGSEDGIFGAKTYNAVLRFQKDVKITADGIVGPKTRTYLGLSPTNTYSQVSRGSRTITMVATGYCPCAKCNWPYVGQPSYLGYPLKRGIIAVDPKVIPMGSRLYVPGYGEGIAADQGNAIKGNRIDLFFNTHQEALKWGIKTVKVTVY